ncbi:MAG TPA: acyl carrier protein [Candidatus Limnocylindria bacterium]|nr:acyl carrier protein [Candidatus Limnocylindria bacterium]
MGEQVERRLRALVAERLGIGEHELERNVSLRDDLAVDSLDLVELAVAIEEAWDVTLPDRLLAQVRTYGELAAATIDRVLQRRRRAPRPGRPLEAMSVRARIVPAAGSSRAPLERTEMLTPYTIESIGEDTLRAGPGAQLQLTLPVHCDDAAMHKVRDRFAWLAERRIEVRVSRARVPARLDVQGRFEALDV